MSATTANFDAAKFRKVAALMTGGATEGERAAAQARAEAIASRAGMTLKQAMAKVDEKPTAKPANFFDGFDDWMEEREPGYKARQSQAKAEKAASDAILRKAALEKYGSEAALFARSTNEQKLASAIHDMAAWREWTDNDGVVHFYADSIDGQKDFWRRDRFSERVYRAVYDAYLVPSDLGGVLGEYRDWDALQKERELFCGGEWQHHNEVEARIAVLKDILDNRAAASWGDLEARMEWWGEALSWGFAPSLDEERVRKERIASDIAFLRARFDVDGAKFVTVTNLSPNSDSEKGPQIVRTPAANYRTNADRKAAVLAAIQENPGLSDRQIAGLAGVSHQTVNNWRKRLHRQAA